MNHPEASEISVKGQLTGRRILMTGTTGFLGTVVLEKLIRAVPEVGKIILLLRGNSQHKTARERFEHEIAAKSIFGRLREEHPAGFREFCRDKIECVTGDVTEDHFGLGTEAFARLAERIDGVIHAAACVNFREELHRAISINALSLLNVVEVVKAAGNIPLVHVSTCFVNGFNQGPCHEEVVSPARRAIQRNPKGFYEVRPLIALLLKKVEEVKLACPTAQGLSDSLIDLGEREAHRYGWNDAYAFTKWMAEQLVMEELQGSTVTIVRPSIIESTLEEPVAGWLEGLKVADAITLAYARQKTLFFPARTQGIIDIIPVDLVANSLILALAEALAAPGKQRIYQCCSGSTNPVRLGRMIRIQQLEMNNNHMRYDRLLPQGKPKREFWPMNQGLFLLAMVLLKSVVLSYAWICKLMGLVNRLPGLTAYVHTTMKLVVAYSFYGAPRYRFHNEKLMDLASRITPEERRRFAVDARIIDWDQYMGPIQLAGLNRYVLKDRSRRPVAAKVENLSPVKGKLGSKAA